MATHQSNLILKLLDQVTGPARLVGRALAGLHGNMANLRRATVNLAPLSTGLTLAGRSLFNAALDVEQALAETVALTDDFDFRDRLLAEAQRLDKDLPLKLKDVLEGANNALSAGLDMDNVLASLRAIANVDVVGGRDFGSQEAADLVTQTGNAFGLLTGQAEDVRKAMNRVADVFSVAVTRTAIPSLVKLRYALQYGSGAIAAIGGSVEDAVAISAAFAKIGLHGEQAGTAIRAITSTLADLKPHAKILKQIGLDYRDYFGKRAEKIAGHEVMTDLFLGGLDESALAPFAAEISAVVDSALADGAKRSKVGEILSQRLGLSAEESARRVGDAFTNAGRSIDLTSFLADLRTANADLATFNELFGKEHGSKIRLALDRGELFEAMRIVRESEGAADRLAQRMQGRMTKALHMLSASWGKLGNAIAQSGVFERLAGWMDGFSAWAEGLAKVNPRLLELATGTAAVVAVLPAFGFALSGAAAALTVLSSPITLAAGALATLAYLLKDEIWASSKGALKGFQEGLDPATIGLWNENIANLKGNVRDLLDRFSETDASLSEWDRFGQAIGGGLATAVNEFVAFDAKARVFVDGLKATIADGARSFLDGITATFGGEGRAAMAQAGTDFVAGLWDGMQAKWAEFMEWVRGLPGQIAAAFRGLAVNIPIIGGAVKMLGGAPGIQAPAVGDFSEVQARVKGGPIRFGDWYVAGEQGPEIFKAGRSGYMHNARDTQAMMGGGRPVTVNASFHVSASSPDDFARKAFRHLEAMLTDTRQLSFEGRPVTT